MTQERQKHWNNLAFVDLMKMRFTAANAKLDSVLKITDNQVELLVADIQLMRLCQRESLNKEFYDYYEKAQKDFIVLKKTKHCSLLVSDVVWSMPALSLLSLPPPIIIM